MANSQAAQMTRAVQRYQVQRMRETHELLFRSPRYGPLCEFFVCDLYGPRDAAPRTRTFHSVSKVLRPVLGQRIFLGAQRLVELQQLSDDLDNRLATSLTHAGHSDGFSSDEFEAAFRACENDAERRRQLELSIRSTTFVHGLSRKESVKRLFRAARKLHGLRLLHSTLDLLDRGYRAFRPISDIRPFVRSMREGESTYLDRVFGLQADSEPPS